MQGNTYIPEGWNEQQSKKKKRGLIIFLIVIAAVVLVGVVAAIGHGFQATKDGVVVAKDDGKYTIYGDYVAELYVSGEIDSGYSYSYSTEYSHEWMKAVIRKLQHDPNNKGIIFYVDTPGGSAYATAEMTAVINKYKAATHRPVYAYYGSEAASGGYYLTCGADKILANQECWTGSIGVTLGTVYDLTGLLSKYGVKTYTITSGKNKAMGNPMSSLTDEQLKIFQGLVDESYERFVGVVAEGRGLSTARVRELADGRIYTAKQALDNGLIDGIAEEDEAMSTFRKEGHFKDCQIISIVHETQDSSLLSSLLSGSMKGQSNSKQDDLGAVKELMKMNGTVRLEYKAQLRK